MVTKLLHNSVSSPWILNLHSLLIQTVLFLQTAYWKSVGTLALQGPLPHGNSAHTGYTLIKRVGKETILAWRLVFSSWKIQFKTDKNPKHITNFISLVVR